MTRRPGLWKGLLGLVVAVLAAASIAACGSSSGDASATSEGTTATASSNESSPAETPTGSPIKVGFLDLSLGVGAVPEAAVGEEAAVKRINDEGGVEGHPIDSVVCEVENTPESNISCANQFVQDKVVAVFDGFDYAGGAVVPILEEAGIPLVGASPFASEAEEAKSAYYFGPSQSAFALGPLLAFQELELEKVTMAATDVPASHAYLNNFVAPAAESLGLNFSSAYYPEENPSFETLAASIVATDPDVAGLIGAGSEQQCTDVVKSMRSAGFTGPVFAGFCTEFIEVLGSSAGEALMNSPVWLPQMEKYAPAATQKQLATAEADLNATDSKDQHGYFAYATYGAWMTLADVLESVQGEFTPQSVIAALKGVKDMPSFLGPNITCNHEQWPNSSACTNKIIIGSLQDDGTLEPVGGEFTTISKSLVPGQ